jgi:polyhydroxyalkanoate synthesis regulator phasin
MKRQFMQTIKKKDLMELVGGDINSGGGDKPFNSDSEIETGPVEKPYNDNSDYEKGQATTGDRVFGRYRQNIPWFAVYSYGGTRSGGGLKAFESVTVTKKSVEEKIEDLVKKSSISDLTAKDYNPKVAKLINSIEDAELTEKQLEDLKKAIQNKQKTKNL